jgi:hypothetical protein
MRIGGQHQALLISRDDYCKTTGHVVGAMGKEPRQLLGPGHVVGDHQRQGRLFLRSRRRYRPPLFQRQACLAGRARAGGNASPEDFKDQLDLCNWCGLAQPGPSQLDVLERDIISEQHVAKLSEVGSRP